MNRKVVFMANLISQQRQLGLAPVELHMNSQTLTEFSRDIAESVPDRRSVLARLRNVEAPVSKIEVFEGLRVVENAALTGSQMILRPQIMLGDPDWLDNISGMSAETLQKAAGQAAQEVVRSGQAPWHQPVNPPADAQKDSVSVSDLADGAGINCTTVIMKALENLDPVKDVIVLRFRKDKGVEICSTMSRYGVIGAMQDALGFVARGED